MISASVVGGAVAAIWFLHFAKKPALETKLIKQTGWFWCWAASTEMILTSPELATSSFHPRTWKQAQVVGLTYPDCSSLVSGIDPGVNCDRPGYPDLAKLGVMATELPEGTAPTWEQLECSVNQNSPIYYQYERLDPNGNRTREGHAVVGRGLFSFSALKHDVFRFILVNDPGGGGGRRVDTYSSWLGTSNQAPWRAFLAVRAPGFPRECESASDPSPERRLEFPSREHMAAWLTELLLDADSSSVRKHLDLELGAGSRPRLACPHAPILRTRPKLQPACSVPEFEEWLAAFALKRDSESLAPREFRSECQLDVDPLWFDFEESTDGRAQLLAFGRSRSDSDIAQLQANSAGDPFFLVEGGPGHLQFLRSVGSGGTKTWMLGPTGLTPVAAILDDPASRDRLIRGMCGQEWSDH